MPTRVRGNTIPPSRHASEAVTRSWIERAAVRWQTDGLSYWTARLGATGEVVGVGGAQRHVTGSWNVYYRLAPERCAATAMRPR